MDDQASTPDRAPADGPTPDDTRPLASDRPADLPPPPATQTAATPAPPPPPRTGTTLMEPPPPSAPGTAPAEPAPRPGTVAAMTAAGVGLLGAAIVISTIRTRMDGDLDWSNYTVGLGATAVLVLVAVVAAMLVRRRDNALGREELVTWPGTVGILGVALMFSVGLEDQDWLEDVFGYVVGGIIAGLAIVGYLAARRAAFVVLALFGIGIVYANAFEDLFGDVGDENDVAIVAAIALAVFVVGATVLGWLLPTRATSGAAVAAVGVVGFGLIMAGMLLAQMFSSMFSSFGLMDMGPGEESDPFAAPESPDLDFDNDVWVILGLALLLTVMWALAAARTGHSGFTISAIAMPSVVVPLATFVLAVEHPTWWGVAVAAVGAVLLAGGGMLGRLRARSARSAY
ncbi:hypothetical protein HNR19_004135 [Nocardioides thalensis]|uniref:Uncharacterized protein n=1 Tax=Nocardioides thalensis TaxID=1914755 RepID=A0A853C806_9ACTN|nr:hypothetical protein [Nocardioides thalensis]NYJ03437.1 hypothetical protein [Nocardioides thalensis]